MSLGEVKLGDRVYVLGRGWGKVVSVATDGSFHVSLGKGSIHFLKGGMNGNMQVVYWHNPLLMEPPKDAQFWYVFVEMVKDLYKKLETLFNTGKIPVVEIEDESTSA